MNLLLDTHALIWIFSNDSRLLAKTKTIIADGDTLVFASAASAWEIAIKRALGKLHAPETYQQGLVHYRFTPLDITTEHALAVEHLPPHHTDPFDRLLIAQAQIENLTLVSRDPRFEAYEVPLLKP